MVQSSTAIFSFHTKYQDTFHYLQFVYIYVNIEILVSPITCVPFGMRLWFIFLYERFVSVPWQKIEIHITSTLSPNSRRHVTRRYLGDVRSQNYPTINSSSTCIYLLWFPHIPPQKNNYSLVFLRLETLFFIYVRPRIKRLE